MFRPQLGPRHFAITGEAVTSRVYLRTHHGAWTRNQRVRLAVKAAASGEALLARINADTL